MAYATLRDRDTILVQSTWDEKDLIKQVPGAKWDPSAKVWYLRLSWAACLQLRAVFGDRLTVGEDLNEWAWRERSERITPALELRERYEGYELDANDGLHVFQRVGRDWLLAAGDALLADEMGTGKTVQALAALEALHYTDSDSALPALVICPNSVKTHWATEARSWFPRAVPYVVTGSAAERKKILATARADPRALVIVNVEAVRLLSRLAPYGSVRLTHCRKCDKQHGQEALTAARCEVHPKELNDFPLATVIIDEAHRIKTPTSKQTRAVWAVAHGSTVRRRWALTGTPIANNPADLWSIMHAVAPHEYPSKTRYVDRYCLLAWNNFGGMDVIGVNPHTKDEFYRILDPRFRRMLKSLVAPQLPPKVRSVRYVELTPKQRRAYKELDDGRFTEVDGELLIAADQLSATTRMMQLASSWLEVGETGAVTLREPSPKLDELELILDELGDEQVVVASESRQLIMLARRRLEKLKISSALIVGGTSEWEKQEALRTFNEGHTRCMLITVKAGGTGINLQRARNLVNIQRSWSMIDCLQTEDRIHRIGSEVHDSVNIIDVVAVNTIEQRQVLAIHDKLERLEEITRDRERLLAAGGYDTYDLDAEETAIMNSHVLRVTP